MNPSKSNSFYYKKNSTLNVKKNMLMTLVYILNFLSKAFLYVITVITSLLYDSR